MQAWHVGKEQRGVRDMHARAQAGPVVDAGGIFEYARQTGMMKTA